MTTLPSGYLIGLTLAVPTTFAFSFTLAPAKTTASATPFRHCGSVMSGVLAEELRAEQNKSGKLALAALVLADLGLPTLLEVAHGFCSWG